MYEVEDELEKLGVEPFEDLTFSRADDFVTIAVLPAAIGASAV